MLVTTIGGTNVSLSKLKMAAPNYKCNFPVFFFCFSGVQMASGYPCQTLLWFM